MAQTALRYLEIEWNRLIAGNEQALDQLQQLVTEQSQLLADDFYAYMLTDPAAAVFLTHEEVHQRLNGSLQDWLLHLYSPLPSQGLDYIIESQQQIGQVHARINVPVSLVLRGAHLLKWRLIELAEARIPTGELRYQAVRLISGLMELALEIMCHSFAASHDRSARAEEAYRLFSIAHNPGAERERQRAALLDWENQLLFDLATETDQLLLLRQSDFGLWFQHKAVHVFQGARECEDIEAGIRQLDQALEVLREIPVASRRERLSGIRDQLRSLKYLLESLFEQATEMEVGRDPLTNLLNRKFLPVVVSREIFQARESSEVGFAVLMLDIDHFKAINDTFGHDSGDAVLQQVAALLSGNTRSGDHVFRLGGEEFLVVLAGVEANQALLAAEKLRKLVARGPFRLPSREEIPVSVSIGVAVHDGHPDYQHLLQRADQALYQAKTDGRNRCILSE